MFLPLKRRDGSPQPNHLFARVRGELVDRFGGLTAFTRAPAEGLWESSDDEVQRDEIVVIEVMAETIEERWWADYRQRLERDFAQEALVIRATKVRLL